MAIFFFVLKTGTFECRTAFRQRYSPDGIFVILIVEFHPDSVQFEGYEKRENEYSTSGTCSLTASITLVGKW